MVSFVMMTLCNAIVFFVQLTTVFAHALNYLEYRNVTTPTPTIDCKPSCIAWQTTRAYDWVAASVVTQITAATVITVINKKTNATRLVTSYNELPDGYALPPTNAAGTQTAVVTYEVAYNQSTTIALAYPTGFWAYPQEYFWSGTLPTTNSLGQSVCSTVTTSTTSCVTGVSTESMCYSYSDARLKAGKPTCTTCYTEPAYVTIPYNSYSTSKPPLPTIGTVNPKDSQGWTYSLVDYTGDCKQLTNGTAAKVNPDDAAPKLCPFNPNCPVYQMQTAEFLTDSSTSYEDDEPTSAPTSRPSSKGSSKASSSSAKQSQPTTLVDATQVPTDLPSSAAASAAPAHTATHIASSTVAVINGASQTIQHASPGSAKASVPAITIGSSTVTANAESEFVIDSHTLFPGSVVTVSGTTISIPSQGSVAVVNGATQTIQQVPEVVNGKTTSTLQSNGDGGIAGAIMSGLGGAGASSTTNTEASGTESSVAQFTGAGGRVDARRSFVYGVLWLCGTLILRV